MERFAWVFGIAVLGAACEGRALNDGTTGGDSGDSGGSADCEASDIDIQPANAADADQLAQWEGLPQADAANSVAQRWCELEECGYNAGGSGALFTSQVVLENNAVQCMIDAWADCRPAHARGIFFAAVGVILVDVFIEPTDNSGCEITSFTTQLSAVGEPSIGELLTRTCQDTEVREGDSFLALDVVACTDE